MISSGTSTTKSIKGYLDQRFGTASMGGVYWVACRPRAPVADAIRASWSAGRLSAAVELQNRQALHGAAGPHPATASAASASPTPRTNSATGSSGWWTTCWRSWGYPFEVRAIVARGRLKQGVESIISAGAGLRVEAVYHPDADGRHLRLGGFCDPVL
ncbi:MAG: hypothetical protein MZV70_50660 [Desulfobacterales bacterium]|nr:hypothetical protein [Desulfobacterales bacterium]